VSRGTSGEAAGQLGEEKVGVTAGIVTEGRSKSFVLLRGPRSVFRFLDALQVPFSWFVFHFGFLASSAFETDYLKCYSKTPSFSV